MRLLHLMRDDGLVERMAADLKRLDAFRTERDAIRCLLNRGGYRPIEIALYIEDARYAAAAERRA